MRKLPDNVVLAFDADVPDACTVQEWLLSLGVEEGVVVEGLVAFGDSDPEWVELSWWWEESDCPCCEGLACQVGKWSFVPRSGWERS